MQQILGGIISNIYLDRIIKGVINRPFIITVKTDNTGTSNNDQFTLPLVSPGTYDFTVYSSDGTIFHTDDYTDNTMTFKGGAGTYTLYITGILKGWSFNNGGDCKKLTGISQVGVFDHGDEDGAFYGCSNLTSISDTDSPLIKPESTDIVGFFRGSGVTSVDWSLYDFTNIEDATDFLNGVTLGSENLESLLSKLQNDIDDLQDSVPMHLGSGTYSIGDPATTIYNLITDKSWTITTGGLEYGQPISYWGDFADTSTITDTSDAVDSVSDKSLNSVGLTATTTQRPSTNSRTQNGLNVLDFNGTSNFMTFSTNDIVDIPFTVFIVAQVDATTQQTILGRQTGSTSGQWTLNKNGGFSIFQSYAFGASPPATGTVKTFNTDTNIHCIFLEDGSTLQYQLNNDTPSTDTNTLSGYDNSVATALVLGASPGGVNFLDGAVGEIITFSGILSSGDRTEIATYLNDKWSVY